MEPHPKAEGGGNGVGGVNSLEPGVGQSLDTNGMIASTMASSFSTDSAISDYMVQQGISEATGGQAFWSTNDVSGALDEVTEVDGNYYTLTYSPTNKNDDGKRRSIRVKLENKQLKLAYRRFYFTGAFGQEQLSKEQPGNASHTSATARPMLCSPT